MTASNLLLGIGNPLLDISSKVDQAVLDKYGVCTAPLGFLHFAQLAPFCSNNANACSLRTGTRFWRRRSTCLCMRCASMGARHPLPPRPHLLTHSAAPNDHEVKGNYLPNALEFMVGWVLRWAIRELAGKIFGRVLHSSSTWLTSWLSSSPQARLRVRISSCNFFKSLQRGIWMCAGAVSKPRCAIHRWRSHPEHCSCGTVDAAAARCHQLHRMRRKGSVCSHHAGCVHQGWSECTVHGR